MTPEEEKKRNQLREKKPYVVQKLERFEEKLERGESIAIVNLQYNYMCNFRCRHCSIAPLRKRGKHRSLTPVDVADISRQADEMGLAQIVITGGEALMFPDLDAVIKSCQPQKFYLELETNGWLMDEGKVEYLKAAGIDKVLISLDSLDPNEHDYFRRKKGAWERAVHAIEDCISAGLSTTVNTVVTKQRVWSWEFETFLKCMTKMGARVFAIYAKPVGEWQGNYDVLLDEQDIAYIKELEKKYAVFTHQTPGYGMNWGCIAVKRMFTITQYGDVKPCPFIDLSLGNVFARPLKDIVERGMRAKCFQSDNCLIGTDRGFIEKYLDDIKGEKLPVPFDEEKYQ